MAIDTASNASASPRFLTVEIEEDTGDSGKGTAAQSMGRRRGAALRGSCRRGDDGIAREAAANGWAK
jgi:hypothetical protein